MSFEGVLNWRLCKKCFNYFDIGTNFDICPSCRKEERMKFLEEVDALKIKEERENGN